MVDQVSRGYFHGCATLHKPWTLHRRAVAMSSFKAGPGMNFGSVMLSAALFLTCVMPVCTMAQEKAEPHSTTQAPGVVSTGGAHSAVLDSEKRPITAGGFVDSGPVVFKDVSKDAGLTNWHHVMGTPEKTFILETVGSGVALLDYDNDGWLDIYLVNGSTYDAMSGKASPPHAALFHNNHDGTFTDVAQQAGVTNDRWGFGVAVGDYDNDGWPDLYVTNYGKNRLYHNNHDGTFTDVTEKAGVSLGNWSTGATFGDYDGDGRLDLFVPGYVHYDIEHPPVPGSAVVAFSTCEFRGLKVMCGPRGLKGEPDHLFHNNGDGTFTDVSVRAGVSDANAYYGLTAIFADLNNDGKVDLAVANDSTPNYLYINKGDGTFEDASYASGYALNENGRETASMGIAVGDYLNRGLLDLYNTVFSDDYNPLYRNDGGGNFSEVSYQAEIAEPTIPFLGWGTGFLDFDNDGWKDLFAANGHVYPGVDKSDWGTTFAERPLLFRNLHDGKFELVPPVKGTGLALLLTARGAAFGDLFNDGKIDVVINQLDNTPVLLRNVNPDKNHWVEIKLVGGPKSPRDATGASVYLTASGVRQRADVISGGSFASSNDPRLHFGLGNSSKIESVEIHWPSGTVEHPNLPAVDRIFTIGEGKGVIPEN
jgi:enediyne biosynthesis protein E4